MPVHDLRRGALYMIAAGLLFAGVGAIIKIVSQSLPNEMVVFFRSVFGLIALVPWLVRGDRRRLATRYPLLHLTRALAGLGAMYCYFYALAHLPLAEATLLNYSTPLFVPFIALVWLHEGIPHRLWWAVGVGFAGILLILKPGMELFAPVSLVGVAAGMFAAVAMTSIRRMSRSEPALRIVFYFSLVCTLGSSLPLAWRWQTPDARLWVLLIAMGALATLAQVLLTRAYACAPAAQVGPFTYSTVVFAALAGWLLWGEVLDAYSLLGAVFVCIAGIMTIRYVGRRAVPAAAGDQ